MNTSTTNSASETASTTPTTSPTTGYSEGEVTNTTVEETTEDDFGYDAAEETPAPKEAEVKPTETEEVETKVEKPATGYSAEDDKEEEIKPEEKLETEPTGDEEKVKKEISESLKKLPEGFDKEKITKFALDNKLTKEQVEAYVKFEQEETARFEQERKAAIEKQKKDWKSELKNDPVFGGKNNEDFARNLDKAEKVLQEFMPETKKRLTEVGSMLPPYVMKDLLKLHKFLNPNNKLVGGEPPSPAEEGNFLDELYQ